MLSQILQEISGLGGWASFGLLIFLGVFVFIGVHTIRLKSDYLEHMSHIPLDARDSESQKGDQ